MILVSITGFSCTPNTVVPSTNSLDVAEINAIPFFEHVVVSQKETKCYILTLCTYRKRKTKQPFATTVQ